MVVVNSEQPGLYTLICAMDKRIVVHHNFGVTPMTYVNISIVGFAIVRNGLFAVSD